MKFFKPIQITLNINIQAPVAPDKKETTIPGTVRIGHTGRPWIQLPDWCRWLKPGSYTVQLVDR